MDEKVTTDLGLLVTLDIDRSGWSRNTGHRSARSHCATWWTKLPYLGSSPYPFVLLSSELLGAAA